MQHTIFCGKHYFDILKLGSLYAIHYYTAISSDLSYPYLINLDVLLNNADGGGHHFSHAQSMDRE